MCTRAVLVALDHLAEGRRARQEIAKAGPLVAEHLGRRAPHVDHDAAELLLRRLPRRGEGDAPCPFAAFGAGEEREPDRRIGDDLARAPTPPVFAALGRRLGLACVRVVFVDRFVVFGSVVLRLIRYRGGRRLRLSALVAFAAQLGSSAARRFIVFRLRLRTASFPLGSDVSCSGSASPLPPSGVEADAPGRRGRT